jgi:hypothetical protein
MLSEIQRRFVESRRVGHLATAEASGAPFLTPVCFGLDGDTLYITIDEKPKRRDKPLKRVRNILENPNTAFLGDRYAQYRAMNLTDLPVIVLRVARVVSWGDLSD